MTIHWDEVDFLYDEANASYLMLPPSSLIPAVLQCPENYLWNWIGRTSTAS